MSNTGRSIERTEQDHSRAESQGEERARILAAGSLRTVLGRLLETFLSLPESGEVAFDIVHGPAGLLRERIEDGERPDLFLSANVEHPARLAKLGLAAPPMPFARNRMVAVVRDDIAAIEQNLITRLLDPSVTIATSTPGNDPSGDYAWAIFRRIDAVYAGAFDLLDAKAQKLVGAAVSPGNYDAIAVALESGAAQVFLGYATGTAALVERVRATRIIELAPEITVPAIYALSILHSAKPAAQHFVDFILSAEGQTILQTAGFLPIAA